MSFRCGGRLAAVLFLMAICVACGQVYRPVVIPTSLTPPNPGSFHQAFSLNVNAPYNAGSAFQIDVSGDTDIGAINFTNAPSIAVNPTHAAILPNTSRIFVANAGSLFNGTVQETDSVTSFVPISSFGGTGLTAGSDFPLPLGSLPVFVSATTNTAAYVANYGANSVTALNTSLSVVGNTAAVGAQPVAMAETPDGLSLYVTNQGDNTVTAVNTVDMSTAAVIPVGSRPVWAAVRTDGERIYVVTQGDGKLYTIEADTNTVIGSQTVGGAGANFVTYDKSRNRVYVTNPTAGAVYVFDATTDPPTPLGSANGAVSIPGPTFASPLTTVCATFTCAYSSVTPVSVAALPDGSRFYVVSYVTGTATSGGTTTCPDTNVSVAGCIIPQVTVFDAGSFAVKTNVFPLLSPVTTSGTTAYPFAIAPVAYCSPLTPYAPTNARFRVFTVASADSSRVYASMCDGGSVASIMTTTSTIIVGANNTPDTLVLDLNAPYSATLQSNNEPFPQNPIFLLTGQ